MIRFHFKLPPIGRKSKSTMNIQYTQYLQQLYNKTKHAESYNNWSSLVKAKFVELENDTKSDHDSWILQEEDRGVKIYMYYF